MEKIVTHRLYWVDEKNDERQAAGVAFYSDSYGEFRLKIDFFPEHKIYLRTIGSCNGQVNYQAEVVSKQGKGFCRRVVGRGFINNRTKSSIHVDLFPFSKELVLDL